MTSAIEVLQRKLAFLQSEEALAVDPLQKFRFVQDIAETKAKLEELKRESLSLMDKPDGEFDDWLTLTCLLSNRSD
jgi:hypothetical protein